MTKRHITKARDHQYTLELFQLYELFAAARHLGTREYAILLLLYDCGLRASEPGLIKSTDIDFAHGEIDVTRVKGSISGVQELAPATIVALKEWLQENNQKTPWLFPGRDNLGINRYQVSYIYRKAAILAGFSKRLQYPHILKHSRATHLIEAGATLGYIQYRLGHRWIKNTYNYIQLTQKAIKEGNQLAKRLMQSEQ